MSRAICYIFGVKKELIGKESHPFLRFFAVYCVLFYLHLGLILDWNIHAHVLVW